MVVKSCYSILYIFTPLLSNAQSPSLKSHLPYGHPSACIMYHPSLKQKHHPSLPVILLCPLIHFYIVRLSSLYLPSLLSRLQLHFWTSTGSQCCSPIGLSLWSMFFLLDRSLCTSLIFLNDMASVFVSPVLRQAGTCRLRSTVANVIKRWVLLDIMTVSNEAHQEIYSKKPQR